MAPQLLDGFTSLRTHHCVTGSMRHVYVHNRHDISEDMLLGIGSGVGFIYWHQKGAPPFVGGRANVERPGVEGLPRTAGRRTGLAVQSYITSSARRAESALLEMLNAGQPVMVQCDMGFLPYFDFGGIDYHFGWHVVVVCGYDADSGQVLVADRDGVHAVSVEDLERARGSTYRPFPPKHKWYTFDFGGKRQPTTEEVWQAISEQAQPMLEPPIGNFGVEGIRRAAQRAVKWPNQMDGEALRFTLFNMFLFIDATGGTGGGLFRTMFSRFLREAAEITGEASLNDSADEFENIGEQWENLGQWFRQASEAPNPASLLGECVAPFNALADLEEAAWARLLKLVQRSRGART